MVMKQGPIQKTTVSCRLDTSGSVAQYEQRQKLIALMLPIGYQLEKVAERSLECDVSGYDVRLRYDSASGDTTLIASYSETLK